MPFDLTVIDAQLAALGPVPANLRELVEGVAAPRASLAEVDAELDALGAADLHFESTPRPLPKRQDPRSGEISLPDPAYRPHLPASGELNLDEHAPRSGSYALETDITDLPDDEELHSAAPPADVLHIPVPSAPRIEITTSTSVSGTDLSPLSLFPEGDDEPATSRDLLEAALPVVRKVNEDVSLKKPRTPLAGRDPDAEFDSLFEDATSPSGVPTRSLDEDGLSVEDLLSGLASQKPVKAPAAGTSESQSALDALFDLDDAESTEIVEAKSVFGEGGLPNLDPFPAEEELGSSEFEIVLDEAGEAKDIVRSDRPGPKNSPPPPTSEDKRPSFLGRLFGKKDE